MSRSFTKKIKALLLFLPLVFVISFCQNANAEMISADNLYKMSLLTSLRTCFEHANSPVSILGLDSWEKFFDTSGNWGKTNSQEVWITTHVGNTLKSDNSDSRTRDSNLSCEQLFKGYDGGKQGQAKGLLDLFQLPAINSTNMGAWGYKLQQSTTPSPSDEPTTGGNDVKITITDIKSLDGNQNPITSEGDITCHGFPQGDEGKNYHYFTNCEGEIKTYYHPNKEKTQLLFVIKATVNAPGRKWLAAAFDYNVNTTSTEYSGFSAPDDDTCVENKLDGCELLKWEHGPSRPVDELIRGAQNIHANDWSKKSMLEILNGDAASPQTGYGSLTYRIYMMAKSVFVMKYSEPSFKVKVEAVTNEGGGESGGGSQLETTNYEVISDKQTAGDIFAYNVNFDESLPHIGTQIGGVKFKNYYFDHTAKYSLYYRYLLEIINLWPDEININTCSETKPENGYYFKNKIDQWCNINIPGSLTEDTMGTNILKYTFSTAEDTSFQLRKGTFEQVLDWFKNEESYKDIPEDAYARGQIGDDGDLDPLDPDPGDGGSGSGDPCYGASGAMGWIVCPVVTWLGKTIKTIYGQAVEPMLQIKSELFNNSKKGGQKTYQAWEIFRNIANIMFVVLFLVVIVSQLTGVGIDNYGIKKILPKLIVAAVLINLSYIICQLAVDVSNIAGAGLNGLLSSQAAGMSGMSGTFNAGTWFEHVLDAFLLVLGVGGITSIALTVINGGLAALLLPLLMGFITAFVAVLFFFALLGMRQAGVVILVVTSPVAFACYMLPNTKKLFDKWLKLFEGLLILYPICGLLVGGSTLSSTILISGTTDFFIWLIGLLLMVVPFFFIPTLLKGSFAAMGSVGAKITGWGSKFGKGLANKTDGTIKNTDAYKSHEQYRQGLRQFRQDRHAERRAQRIQNRLGGRTTLSDRQRHKLAGANQTLLDTEKRRRQNAINARGDQFSAAMTKQDLEIDENAYEMDAYNNADFVSAKRAQGQLNRGENIENTLLYNDADYVEGKRQQGILKRDDELGNAIVYNDADYRAGKAAQSRLAWGNDFDNTVFYTRPGFEASKRRQYDAQRQSEIRKMYSEQYSKMDKGGRQRELITGLRSSGADAVEQVDAAFDSLMSTGDVAEVLDAFGGADFTTMDADVRARAVARAAASGNQLLKGWAKTGGAVNLQDYIDNAGTNGLRDYLSTQAGVHAFDNADKDTLTFLAGHNGAQAMSDAMIASLATSAAASANQTATNAVVQIIHNRGNGAAIGAAINAEGLTKMSNEVAIELGSVNLRDAINEINNTGNEAMRTKVNSDVKRTLGVG